ncbi:Glutamate receptor-like 69 [Homarus americanus]|uniref:Glutamate receptor-like 69 n=2 Tax=Homarus americanus TaxID=6706 RepID=A0A8J5MW35_HOMAM|nr:Glutamate receptor-like 69 [Homarus americanus]
MPYPVIIDYEKGKEPGTPLTPKDSLDVHMLDIIAKQLNFTYELREPLDKKWGTRADDGNWTGIVGTLQHQQADFSLDLTLTESRSRVMDYSRVYYQDPIVIVSPKPTPLPRHLALTRPFEGELWLVVAVCTLVLGIILWLLQKIWSWASGDRGASLVSTLFDSWGMLLMKPVTEIPTNTNGRVLVGWWLLTCVIITTAYRSSFIAHLSVQSKYPPINNFQDLLNRDGWSWGSKTIQGSVFIYFNQSSDPDIQKIFRKMEIYSMEDGLKRVLTGGFSLIVVKIHVRVHAGEIFFDQYGNSPYQLARTEYPIFGGNVWGFRQGAPFTSKISKMKGRLIEAGLLNLWLDDIIKTQTELKETEREREKLTLDTEESSTQVVLGLDHLQGGFYLLLLGCYLAFLAFIAEMIVHC